MIHPRINKLWGKFRVFLLVQHGLHILATVLYMVGVVEACCWLFFIPPMAQRPIVSQGLITEASRPQSEPRHSIGILCTSGQPDAETYLTTRTTSRDENPCSRLDSNPQSQQASSQTHAFRRRGYWDRFNCLFTEIIKLTWQNYTLNCYDGRVCVVQQKEIRFSVREIDRVRRSLGTCEFPQEQRIRWRYWAGIQLSHSEIDAFRYREANKCTLPGRKEGDMYKKKKTLIFRRICDLFTGFWWSKSIYSVREKKKRFFGLAREVCTRCQTHMTFPSTVKFERTPNIVKHFHLFFHIFKWLILSSTVVTMCTTRFKIQQVQSVPHTVYLYVLYGSQNKQRLYPYAPLTDWS